MQNKTIKIELCAEKKNSTEHFYSSVWLPAKDYEIMDAYHKARITTEPDVNMDVRIESCPLLPELVGTRLDSPTMDELNFFARRLASLNQDERMVLKAVKSKYLEGDEDELVSMKDLINLTYGLKDIMVFPEIKNDEMLGEFVIENNLHPDISAIPDQSLYLINKEMIGKLHRENEGGVFVDEGYVFTSEYERPEIYDGKRLLEEDKGLEFWYAFRLEIVKEPKGGEEVQETNDWLSLPAELRDLEAYAKKYGKKDIKDCVYLGFESAIPQIKEHHFGDMRKIHDLNVLAKMYMEMPPTDKMKFKAVLEAGDVSNLEKMISIAWRIDKYELDAQIDNPTEYFKEYIARHLDKDFDREWLDSLSIYNEGRTLLNRTSASITSYGAVSYYNCPLYKNVSKYPKHPCLDDSFDLIEVCGQKALFTNERIHASELPEGVYKYDLRDGIPIFASIEKHVRVDHAGTVLTREPIDLGKDGCIEFDEETSPNFLGDEMTLRDYLTAEFSEDETEEQSMEGITQ
jgi:hypothetical protein